MTISDKADRARVTYSTRAPFFEVARSCQEERPSTVKDFAVMTVFHQVRDDYENHAVLSFLVDADRESARYGKRDGEQENYKLARQHPQKDSHICTVSMYLPAENKEKDVTLPFPYPCATHGRAASYETVAVGRDAEKRRKITKTKENEGHEDKRAARRSINSKFRS